MRNLALPVWVGGLGVVFAIVFTAPSPAGAQTTAPEDPAASRYQTIVTALRLPRPLPDVPSTVTVLPREELDRVPGLGTDEMVRLAPVASLFRRTPSLLADPSAQGLSLRALGPSGVSRALLLVDGVPFNDPFGGWVYWRALPRLGLDRIEVMPGAGSPLYGNHALGGVVQLASRPLERALEADVSGGNLGTAALAARAAGRWRTLGGAIEFDGMRSDGYIPVVAAERGAIDIPGASRHGGLNARLEAPLGANGRIGTRAGLFAEDQNGGTALTTANVRTATYALTLGHGGGEQDAALDFVFYGSVERFTQERARIGPQRMSETLAAEQRVRAHSEGGSLLWRSPRWSWLGFHQLLLGTDLRRVTGAATEELQPAQITDASVIWRRSGGAQDFAGVFVQEVYAPVPAVELVAGLRADWWRSHAGLRSLVRASGASSDETFAAQNAARLSPRLAVLVRPSPQTRVRASWAQAFRAPNLNELYRPFQVGTVLTEANADLRAERLTGAELGGEFLLARAGSLRLTGFWARLSDPIANVTLPAAMQGGATRQRQNLGQVTARGADALMDVRFPLHIRARTLGELIATAAYSYAQSQVTEAPAQPELTGKEVPQSSRHRGRLALAWRSGERFEALVQARMQSRSFEDDLNTLPMAGFAVLDLFASAAVFGPRGQVFVGVQNLLDQRYLVGRAGIDSEGPPLQVMVGVRTR